MQYRLTLKFVWWPADDRGLLILLPPPQRLGLQASDIMLTF